MLEANFHFTPIVMYTTIIAQSYNIFNISTVLL